jgi:hypothetical protein
MRQWTKTRVSILVSLVSASIATPAAAASGGARTAAANHPANVQNARSEVSNRSAHTNENRNTNVNANVNRNTNANVNRNTNVNVNRNVHVEGGGYDRWGHPVAAATAVTATAVAVGTVAAALPSSGCSAVSVGGVTYQRCGPNYYQPVYQGDTVQYVVVSAP